MKILHCSARSPQPAESGHAPPRRPPWPAAAAGMCALLTLLLLSQQRLQIQSLCVPASSQNPQETAAATTAIETMAAAATHAKHEGPSSASITAGPSASCQPPPVEHSLWADSCTLLRNACVDQGSIILYGEEHRMTAEQPGTAPFLIEPEPDFKKYIFLHRNSTGRDYRYALPPIRVRPASSTEGTPYLAEPSFSSCTVPLVWYPMWAGNVAHMFRDNAAKLWGMMQDTPWAPQHLKLVLVTAEGHAAPEMNYQITQSMVQLSVETWADFSSRLPAQRAAEGAGYVPVPVPGLGASAAAPPSFEGGPRRCFRQMLVCPRGLNITRWPLHGLGQHLVRHYSNQLAALLPPMPPAAATVASASGSSSIGSGSAGGGAAEKILRVVFHKRSSADRQLLNAAELVARCNSWRHTTAAGLRMRASCQEVEMTDLLTGMAAAQEADVFVGVHGANQANTWLMRPGSSMVELQPYGFDAGAAHLQYPLFNMEDSETSVQWWLLSVCDPQGWTPGAPEAAGEGRPDSWPKFRNLIVRWEALERVLRTAVEVGGDMSEYRRRWVEGRWWWWLGPGGEMRYVGKGRRTKLRCPAEFAGTGSSSSSGPAD